MINKIIDRLINIEKKIFTRNLLFVFSVTFIYSLSVNIPLIKMQYPEKYFLLAFAVSIFRDFIIWFIAFINKWIFAVFTFFTFVAGFGLKYMNVNLGMGLNIGSFEVIFSTNVKEAKGIMNSSLITYFILGAVISIVFIILRFLLIRNNQKVNSGGDTAYHSFNLPIFR